MTGAPKTGVPATGAPEAGVAETRAPEAGAPETGAPETRVRQTGSPQTDATMPGIKMTAAPSTDIGSPAAVRIANGMVKVGPIKARLLALQDRLALAYGTDISTATARRAAWWHFQLMDHAFLRALWTNLDRVAPGVWRANQPSQARLKRYFAKLGLKSVLNLRGAPDQGFYLFEAEVCRDLGLTLHDIGLSARRAPARTALLEVLDLLQTLEKPVLIHCKSGADRTGLVAALYLMTVEGRPVSVARKQLSLRYLHVKASATGILDHLLDRYEAEANGRTFRVWVEQDYDADRIWDSFQTSRKS